MSNYVDTIRKATRLGINDANQGFEKNSRSVAGSMWDRYYTKGYDKAVTDKRYFNRLLCFSASVCLRHTEGF